MIQLAKRLPLGFVQVGYSSFGLAIKSPDWITGENKSGLYRQCAGAREGRERGDAVRRCIADTVCCSKPRLPDYGD